MYTTTDAIRVLLGNSYEACQSPSLRLNKYLSLDSGNEKQRTQEINQIVSCCNKYAKQPPLERKFTRALSLVARLAGNLIVNQAGGILENAGLCLDPLQGYPYIPGSAVKGVAQNAAWLEWKDNPSAELALRIARVFGYPTQHRDLDLVLEKVLPPKMNALAGSVSFLAAVPCSVDGEKPMLDTDICTSHHPNYYQGKQKQAYDDESPIPLVFPVVQAGATFLFQMVPLLRADEEICQDARRWLIDAICNCGMGAKTAAGYGWFSFDEQSSEQWLQMVKERINKKRAERIELQNQQRALEEKRLKDERVAHERAAEKARQETMTPEEILNEKIKQMSGEQFFTRIGQFCQTGRLAVAPDEKAALLRALKEPRHEVWEQIRVMKKGKNTPNWPQIVNEIFTLHKQLYNGEKMS